MTEWGQKVNGLTFTILLLPTEGDLWWKFVAEAGKCKISNTMQGPRGDGGGGVTPPEDGSI